MDAAPLPFPDEFFPATYDAAARDAARAAMIEFITAERAPGGDSRGMIDRSIFESDSFYAIHDSDLAFWKEAVGAAGGLAVVTPNWIAIVGGLVVLLYQYRRKRVQIDGLQAMILRVLRWHKADGATRAELDQALGLPSSSASKVDAALKQLEQGVAANGTMTAFIRREGNRIWAVDV